MAEREEKKRKRREGAPGREKSDAVEMTKRNQTLSRLVDSLEY